LDGVLSRFYALGERLGQTEVQNFDLPTREDKDVSRLDIAVDNTFGVGGLERIADLRRKGC